MGDLVQLFTKYRIPRYVFLAAKVVDTENIAGVNANAAALVRRACGWWRANSGPQAVFRVGYLVGLTGHNGQITTRCPGTHAQNAAYETGWQAGRQRRRALLIAAGLDTALLDAEDAAYERIMCGLAAVSPHAAALADLPRFVNIPVPDESR